ncbi:MAG: hypothetical protein WCK51_05660 [Armatimonadota bacterium]
MIPTVIALGLAGVGIVVFERQTGIGPAIAAYRDGEEKCQKYGLFATADELNREYNVPSATYAGEQLRDALKAYNLALGKDPKVANEINFTAKPDGRTTVAQSEILDSLWKRIEPIRDQKVIRIPREFREGYAMLLPEYTYYRQVAQHTLNKALTTASPAEALSLMKDVAWLRSHITDNYESQFPALVARGILRQEMKVATRLLTRLERDQDLVEHAKKLLATEVMNQNLKFGLKYELFSLFQINDPSYPAAKVFSDLGIRPSDPQFEEWGKWRKYPRIEAAWKSTAMDIVSYGYEELQSNPPRSFADQEKFREKLDARQMRFGQVPATAWYPWHPFGFEDRRPFDDAKAELQRTLTKLP